MLADPERILAQCKTPEFVYLNRPKMTTEQINELAKFLKDNEPVLDRNSGSGEYWELFAYRICDYLKV